MKGVIVYDIITKSLVFGTRNFDKVTNTAINDEGRIFATAGQFTNAVKAAAKLDNQVGRGASAAISAMGKVTQNSKVLDSVAKGVNWASKNVNPLLIGAAGYRVFKADNKIEALNREAYGMTAMFAVEKSLNNLFKTQAWSNLIDKIPGSKGKVVGKILQGLLFVGGSITGSTIGYKLGDYMNNKIKGITNSQNKTINSDESFLDSVKSGQLVA